MTTSAKRADSCENEAGSLMLELMGCTFDERAHKSDGLLLHGRDGTQPVAPFISLRFTDNWVNSKGSLKSRNSLIQAQYNALSKPFTPATSGGSRGLQVLISIAANRAMTSNDFLEELALKPCYCHRGFPIPTDG